MDKWGLFAEKAQNLFLEGVNMAMADAEQTFQEVAEKTQAWVDELAERGEEQCRDWFPSDWSATDTPSTRLHRELLTLLQGDEAVAERLLAHARRNAPNRSEKWYYEKVIRDLKRDRGL